MRYLLFLFVFNFCTLQAFCYTYKDSTAVRKAKELVDEKDYKNALTLWKDINNQSPKNKEYTAYYNLCKAKIKADNRNYKEAIALYKKEQKALESHEEYSGLLVKIYNGLYHTLAYSGNWNEALKEGEEGLALVYKLNDIDITEKANYIYDLAYINDRLKNYPKAIELYNESINLYLPLENKNFDIGLAYNNLATCYAKIGYFNMRLESYKKAQYYWEINKEETGKNYLNTLYGNLLKLYAEYGDIDHAKDYHLAINNLIDIETEQNISLIASVYNRNILFFNLVNNFDEIKKQSKDFKTFFYSLPKPKQQKISHWLLASLNTSLNVYVNHKLDKEALSLADTIISLADTYKRPYEKINPYVKTSTIYTELKKPLLAIAQIDKAIAISNQINIGKINLAALQLNKAKQLLEINKPDEAEISFHKGIHSLIDKDYTEPTDLINYFKETTFDYYYISAIIDIADYYLKHYQKLNDKQSLRHAATVYLLAAENFNKYYQKNAYNLYLNRSNSKITEGVLTTSILLEEPISMAALTLLEQNKSHVLRKEFLAKHSKFGVDKALILEKNTSQIKLEQLRSLKETNPDSLRLIKNKLARIDEEINKAQPMYLNFYSGNFSADTFLKNIKKDEAIIAYFIGIKNSYAIVYTNHKASAFKLGDTQKIEPLIIAYHQQLKDPKEDYADTSKQLYQVLIEPLDNLLKEKNKLTFIPDKNLNYIPFETLQSETSPLIEDYDISYHSSLSMLQTINNVNTNHNASKKALATFAPNYTANKSIEIVSRSNRFSALEGAKNEAQTITDYFKGDAYIAKNATKQNFIDATTSYQVYHLAMHAILHEQENISPSLVFQDNELLNINAIYNLHFPAELVVLSACNTGIGKLDQGEGLLSLSRALTYAGVKSNVFSLWEVPDKETAEIMINFYKYLKENKEKNTALALAKKDFIKANPVKAHPYYWAGFVVSGDVAEVATKLPFYQNVFFIITSAFFIIIIFFLFFYKKKK